MEFNCEVFWGVYSGVYQVYGLITIKLTLLRPKEHYVIVGGELPLLQSLLHTNLWLDPYLSMPFKCGAHTLLMTSLHWKMYNIMLLDGNVEAGGIILLRGGINPPIIVLMCYIGLH